MQNEFDKIMSKTVTEVLKDGQLLMIMLGLYSKLFLNSKPCTACDKFHTVYYNRLVKEGLKKIKTMKKENETKAKIKGNAILHVAGERVSNLNLTDKKAREIIKKYPETKGQFEILPEGIEDNEEVLELREFLTANKVEFNSKLGVVKLAALKELFLKEKDAETNE